MELGPNFSVSFKPIPFAMCQEADSDEPNTVAIFRLMLISYLVFLVIKAAVE